MLIIVPAAYQTCWTWCLSHNAARGFRFLFISPFDAPLIFWCGQVNFWIPVCPVLSTVFFIFLSRYRAPSICCQKHMKDIKRSRLQILPGLLSVIFLTDKHRLCVLHLLHFKAWPFLSGHPPVDSVIKTYSSVVNPSPVQMVLLLHMIHALHFPCYRDILAPAATLHCLLRYEFQSKSPFFHQTQTNDPGA